LPTYADLVGGTLFHFSGFASSAAALGAAVWARSKGEKIPAAITANNETTKRLDISESSWARLWPFLNPSATKAKARETAFE
jgi:hypothetical protein